MGVARADRSAGLLQLCWGRIGGSHDGVLGGRPRWVRVSSTRRKEARRMGAGRALTAAGLMQVDEGSAA
jgi:hypothetical protein